ncbi:MAG: cytidylate kinase-like family protein [Candidatus Omnitrophica bacterium]|nr:cytidylate kinase-like family protein [Candidatus Omnitrophota bacterium]
MSDIHVIVSRQVKRWELERRAFEEAREEEKKALERPADVKPVVTISRQRGCRGKDLAKLLAHELDYGFFDRDIVDYIARHMGIRSELVESLDEKDRSELELWINSLLSKRVFDHDEYIRALGEAVKTTALQGGVVILGRGANFLLADTAAYHVRLTAPLPVRVDNLCQFEGMSESQAREEIKKVDRERSGFVYRYFKKSIEDPLAYDLTINIAKSTLDGTIKIIRSALRARGWPLELTGGDKRRKSD